MGRAKNQARGNQHIKIEDSHPYIVELVENMPKYWISGENYRPISVGGLDSFYVYISSTKMEII